MYSFKENHSGGEYFSHVTKKSYPFKKTTDSSDKRRALQELEAEERQVREQLTKRLGREPTIREMIAGVSAEDTRSLREKISEQNQKAEKAETNDPLESRIADLKERLNHPLPSSEKERIKRRIKMLGERHKKEQAAIKAKKAEEQRRKAIESDLIDAKINYDNSRLLAGFTADDVRITKSLYDRLDKGDITIEEYQAERDIWEKNVKERREKAASVHEQAAQEQRELAKQIRDGESEPELSRE